MRPFLLQVFHALVLAAPGSHQFNDGTDVVCGRDDAEIKPRLLDFVYSGRIRQVRWAVYLQYLAVGHKHFVGDTRGCGEQVQIILPFQAFLHDIHVEQAQEAAAKA